MHYMGHQYVGCLAPRTSLLTLYHRGYLESCKAIVTAARTIAERIHTEVPELRVLGNPRASVIAFASARKGKAEGVSVLEVGDMMAKKGWHLNALSGPAAVHIAVTRLTVPVVDQFIADLKDAVREAQLAPSGAGTMVRLYGALPFRVRSDRSCLTWSRRFGQREPHWFQNGRSFGNRVLGYALQGVSSIHAHMHMGSSLWRIGDRWYLSLLVCHAYVRALC